MGVSRSPARLPLLSALRSVTLNPTALVGVSLSHALRASAARSHLWLLALVRMVGDWAHMRRCRLCRGDGRNHTPALQMSTSSARDAHGLRYCTYSVMLTA